MENSTFLMTPDIAMQFMVWSYFYHDIHPEKNVSYSKCGKFSEEDAKAISLIPEKYGFTDIQYHLFYRERVFTANEYTQLLGTYSDHIAIEESIRKVFFSKIEDAINRHGGTITISDTMDLELARKI